MSVIQAGLCRPWLRGAWREEIRDGRGRALAERDAEWWLGQVWSWVLSGLGLPPALLGDRRRRPGHMSGRARRGPQISYCATRRRRRAGVEPGVTWDYAMREEPAAVAPAGGRPVIQCGRERFDSSTKYLSWSTNVHQIPRRRPARAKLRPAKGGPLAAVLMWPCAAPAPRQNTVQPSARGRHVPTGCKSSQPPVP